MTLRMVDCNGLGGGMMLGFHQNDFELLYRCGDLNLGAPIVEANRHIVGWDWKSHFTPRPDEWWVPDNVDMVVGSPPCAGFSTMSSREFRGIDSKANDHMKKFVAYAGRVAPAVAAFESVQQAFSQGRELMTLLRDKLEADTGHKYDLYHVLHNNASVGGAAVRARYFWMASRVPFGVEYPVPDKVPTLMESIGDLTHLQMTWEKQPYRAPDTWWSSRRRSPQGVVDGHITKGKIHDQRVRALMQWIDYQWAPGERLEDALLRCYRRYGKLPAEWKDAEPSIVKKNFELGFNQAKRWYPNRPAFVLTGAALEQAIHPTEPRTFTYREAMRIQGMPDDWRLWPVRDYKRLSICPGKGVPVDASRWFGHWVSESFAGRPGSMRGVPDRDRDREYVLQVDKGYKQALARGGYRVHELKKLEGISA
jgi:site-specific DNA-cytosine methylase